MAELKSLAEAKAERDSILAERGATQEDVARAEEHARVVGGRYDHGHGHDRGHDYDRGHATGHDARPSTASTPTADFVVVSLHNSNLQHFVRNSAIREVIRPLFLTLRARFKCPVFLLGDYNATKVMSDLLLDRRDELQQGTANGAVRQGGRGGVFVLRAFRCATS